MNPVDIVKSLEATNSRNAKEAILSEHAVMVGDMDDFFDGCKLALDPHITFGVAQIPSGAVGDGLPFSLFVASANTLASRLSTGNDAKELIEELRKKATNEEWDWWYRRILLKDLKCGVSEKTINKVLKSSKKLHFQIPVFTCQLAHDSSDYQSKMKGKKIIESKLDGVRAIAILTKAGCVIYSRTGKVLSNFDHIARAIELLPEPQAYLGTSSGIVFDGEIMSASFQDLMKQLYRKEHVNASDSVYHMFDVMSLDSFRAGRSDQAMIDRIAMVKSMLAQNESECLTSLEHEIVDLDSDLGQERFNEINRVAVEAGYEGIMIKDLDAPYECKRSSSWMKMKPFIEVSLDINCFEEGTGRNTGKLGAFQCSGVDSGKHIEVNVGNGYTDEQRESFWSGRESLIGHVMEVRADAITQNQDGTYSLRFPRFIRFRGMEVGEKL